MIPADIIMLIMLLAFPAASDPISTIMLIIDSMSVAVHAHLFPCSSPAATAKDAIPSTTRAPPKNMPIGARKMMTVPRAAMPSPTRIKTMPLRIFRAASIVTPIGREEVEMDNGTNIRTLDIKEVFLC